MTSFGSCPRLPGAAAPSTERFGLPHPSPLSKLRPGLSSPGLPSSRPGGTLAAPPRDRLGAGSASAIDGVRPVASFTVADERRQDAAHDYSRGDCDVEDER